MTETPGNSEMDGLWPGEGEDISNDPWPGQEEIGGGDGEQMGTAGRRKGIVQEVMMQLVETRRQKSLRILIYHSLRNRQPPRLNPSFRQSRKLSARGKATVSGRRQKLKKSTISRMPWLFHTVEKTYAIADVNSWLHVREGKGTNQKIVGILPKGSLCYI